MESLHLRSKKFNYKNEHFNDKSSSCVNDICIRDLFFATSIAINTTYYIYHSNFYSFANNIFNFHISSFILFK